MVGFLRYSPRLGPDVSGGLIQHRYGPIGVNKHAPGGRRCDGAVGRGERGRVWTTGEHNMERRKFVLGVGALAAGGAAAVGSGAFTSVEAERQLTAEVVGDASAFVGIEKATEDGKVTPNAQEYVDIEGDGTVRIDFTDSESTTGVASGLNQDAKSVFDNLLDITNNGTQDVVLSVDSDLIASQGGFLGIYAENTQGDGGNDNTGLSDTESGQTTTLGPGEAATNIGIFFPKGSLDQVEDGTLEFVAERAGGNRD